jgi:kumamolisin
MVHVLRDPLVPPGYRQLAGSELRSPPTAVLIGPADPHEKLSVTLLLRRRLDGPPIPDINFLEARRGSAPRTYSSEEFAILYGASDHDIAEVRTFVRAQGMTIESTSAAGRTVVISGTVAQMNKAFAVNLGRFKREPADMRDSKVATDTYRGRSGYVHLPASLSKIVIGVLGLDNRCVARRNNGEDPPNTARMTVQQVCALYNFPDNGARSQTIGIISPSGGLGGFFQSDLQQYFGATMPTVLSVSADDKTHNGSIAIATSAPTFVGSSTLNFNSTDGINVGSRVTVPNLGGAQVVEVTPTTVVINKQLNSTLAGGTTLFFNPDQETLLDICVAGSAAPGALIAVLFTGFTPGDLVTLLKRVAHPRPGDPVCSVLSCSYSYAAGDDPGTAMLSGLAQTDIDAISDAFHDLVLQGVTVCVASGDAGANGSVQDNQAHTAYPASDPWVLTVGGTTIGNVNGAGWDEYVWNDWLMGPPPDLLIDPGATGGGVSDHFARPNYQATANVPPSIKDGHVGRGIPDVAANASINSGYLLHVAGVAFVASGTSAAAPLWAGLIAVLNDALRRSLGFVNPALYFLGSAGFRDINPPPGPLNNDWGPIQGYVAGPGWDACTGWGSPNGTALLELLSPAKHRPIRVAIDPLAVILNEYIYLLLHLPDPIPIEIFTRQIERAIEGLSSSGRHQATMKMKALDVLVQSVRKGLEGNTQQS